MRVLSHLLLLAQIFLFTSLPTRAAEVSTVVISIPEQRLYVFDETGQQAAAFRVSTSKNGLGSTRGSYETPLGRLRISGKVGDGAPVGAVFKSLRRTGEICKINSRGRDPIVTRVMPLEGLEPHNANANARRIYIHGTPEESKIGKPVSYGCIRMRSCDVIKLFDMVRIGTDVEIVNRRVKSGFFTAATWPVRGKTPASTPLAASTTTKPPKAVASVKAPAAKITHPSPVAVAQTPAPSPGKKAADSHVKLMQTSGLTIQLGGGLEREDTAR